MLGSTRQLRVRMYSRPADMRRSFDGLSAVVREKLGDDPLSGDLFLFVSRDRKRAKVLIWDGTGLCVYGKRLERGLFTAPWLLPEASALELTMSELQLFMEGTELIGRLPLSPQPFSVTVPFFRARMQCASAQI
jgi:transposase